MTEPRFARAPASTFRSGSWKGLLLPLIAIGGIGLLLLYSSLVGRDAPSGEQHAAAGTSLTLLQLEPLFNVESELVLDDLAGNVALVNYWGPWCPPCRMEMPHLVELQRDLADRPDFRFVSVACSGGAYSGVDELQEATAKYCSEEEIAFPIYHDESAVSRTALVNDGGLGPGFGFPTTVLLDREGKIVALWEGYSPDVPRQIRAKVFELLDGAG